MAPERTCHELDFQITSPCPAAAFIKRGGFSVICSADALSEAMWVERKEDNDEPELNETDYV